MASPERHNSVSKPAIDREKTTPFLLRLFVRTGGFHRLEEFETPDRLPTQDEVQIYTWKDVTLSELGKLISSAFPQVSRPNTRIAFRLLYTDSFRPRVLLKDVGSVTISPSPQTPSDADDAGSRTLDDVKYVIGDWIDVAIFNNAQGPPMGGGGRFDGPRGPGGGGGFGRGGGLDRGRGRGDSYRGMGSRGRVGGGRNGFDGPGRDRDAPPRDRDGPSRDRDGEGDERGPPGGPRRDRERDRDRDRDRRW